MSYGGAVCCNIMLDGRFVVCLDELVHIGFEAQQHY